MGTRFAHHHASVLFGIESNSNITIVIKRYFNLLNPHLADFAFFPVGSVVKDFSHLGSGVHTIGTLWRIQVTNSYQVPR